MLNGFTNLPTPFSGRVELLIYQRVCFEAYFGTYSHFLEHTLW